MLMFHIRVIHSNSLHIYCYFLRQNKDNHAKCNTWPHNSLYAGPMMFRQENVSTSLLLKHYPSGHSWNFDANNININFSMLFWCRIKTVEILMLIWRQKFDVEIFVCFSTLFQHWNCSLLGCVPMPCTGRHVN